MNQYKNMKPFFQYAQGKQRLSSRIVKLIPDHDVYVEPFFGSGAVFFKKGIIKEKDYLEVINDKNDMISIFFKQVRDNFDQLLHMCKFTPYSRKDKYDAVCILRNAEKEKNIDVAHAFFVSANMGFGGQFLNFEFGYCKKSTGGNCHSKSYLKKIKNFEKLRGRLSQTLIFNIDAFDIIDKFDQKSAFFYIDPPYPDTKKITKDIFFTQDDIDRLVSRLENIKGKFILSGYDNFYYPAYWYKHEINTKCILSKGKREPRKEILLANFKMGEL